MLSLAPNSNSQELLHETCAHTYIDTCQLHHKNKTNASYQQCLMVSQNVSTTDTRHSVTWTINERQCKRHICYYIDDNCCIRRRCRCSRSLLFCFSSLSLLLYLLHALSYSPSMQFIVDFLFYRIFPNRFMYSTDLLGGLNNQLQRHLVCFVDVAGPRRRICGILVIRREYI